MTAALLGLAGASCAGETSRAPDATAALDAARTADAASDARSAADIVRYEPTEHTRYRRCTDPVRDPQGGFCDLTETLGIEVFCQDGEVTCQHLMTNVADFDSNGLPDLLIVHPFARRTRMYLNRGGRFEDVGEAYGVSALPQRSHVVASADMDNDGDPEVMMVAPGGTIQTYRNDDGTLVGPVSQIPCGDCLASAIVPSDLDRDGRLDLLVAQSYNFPVECRQEGAPAPCPGRLSAYRQVRPLVFEPIVVASPRCPALAVRVIDWDRDGQDEILVGVDFGMHYRGNLLFHARMDPNLGLILQDDSAAWGFNHGIYSMGVAAIDVDEDGVDEVLVTNIGRNLLLRRDGATLTDVARQYNAEVYGIALPGTPRFRALDPEHPVEGPISRYAALSLDEASPLHPLTKWTPLLFDYDLDGREDVFVLAGHIGAPYVPEASPQSSAMLRNNGHGFDDVTDALGLRELVDSRSAVATDIDGDGDQDLIISLVSSSRELGRVRVLRNDAAQGRSLVIRAVGRRANRQAIGAEITARIGSRTVHRRLDGNLSIYATGEHQVVLGLGAATVVDELTVRFPGGGTATRTQVPAGSVTIEEPDSP